MAGPICVDGAEPGDALKVTLLDFTPSGWAWTAIVPGFGLLADHFTEPALHIWNYAEDLTPAMYGPGGKVPLKPFCGTIGLAPAEPGPFDRSAPPHGRQHGYPRPHARHRSLSSGQGQASLFSIGDTHARKAMARSAAPPSNADVGSGEIRSGEGRNLKFPCFTTPGPVSRHLDAAGYDVTTGIDPDLMQASRPRYAA